MVGLGLALSIFILWIQRIINWMLRWPLVFSWCYEQAKWPKCFSQVSGRRLGVAHQVSDLDAVITGEHEKQVHVNSAMETSALKNVIAHIPDTTVTTEALTWRSKGNWIPLWRNRQRKNDVSEQPFLSWIPSGRRWAVEMVMLKYHVASSRECIYVTRKGLLVTKEHCVKTEKVIRRWIVHALETVDLTSWYSNLPDETNSG